jgi:hypothetical protein
VARPGYFLANQSTFSESQGTGKADMIAQKVDYTGKCEPRGPELAQVERAADFVQPINQVAVTLLREC